METIDIIILAALAGLAGLVIWKMRGGEASEHRERAEGLEREKAALQARHDEAVQLRVQVETRLEAAQTTIEERIRETADLRRAGDEAVAARHEAERASDVASQQLRDVEKRITDWETAKIQSIEAAKAAALASSRELSAQLMAEHKRESETANKANEARVQKVTEGLQQNFEAIVKNVHTLTQDVDKNRGSVETVMRALSSPGGAGHFAEIGLENTLKAFGLHPERDFIMQHTTMGEDGNRLRPDAVVFLPGDAALVIDSKASKFFLEVAAVEGTEEEEAAYAGLARTMAQHLRDLSNKDYAGAIRETYRSAGRGHEFRKVTTAMYLPSEAAIERLDKADPEFARRAGANHIIPVGPSGLRGLIALSSVNIDLGRQAENQEKIIEATEKLLESVTVALGYAETVGNGLQTAVTNFAKFTSSVNSRLLPRSRALVGLGVRPQGKKKQIRNLSAFEVMKFDAENFIEGDVSQDTVDDDNVVASPPLVEHSDED